MKLNEDQKATLGNITGLLGAGIGAGTGDYSNTVSGGQIGQTVTEHNNAARAAKGVVVPALGALYCALDKGCESVTKTFVEMMAEQRRQAQEERDAIFAAMEEKRRQKAQPQQQQESKPAAGAPMPPDDEDGKNRDGNSDIEELLERSNKLSNRNSLAQYERKIPNRANDKAWKQAQQGFDSLRLQNIRQINTQYGQGRVGTLPDGRTVIVRPGSSNGSPTLQINSKTSNKVIKIRY